MIEVNRTTLLRGILAITVLLTFTVIFQITVRLIRTDEELISRRWIAVLLVVALFLIIELFLLAASWTKFRETGRGFLDSTLNQLSRLGWGNYILLAALQLLFCYLTLGPLNRYFGGLYMKLLLFWLTVLGGSVLLLAAGVKRSWFELYAIALISTAVVYRLALYLPELSTLPLTLGWSEASRYYYASLYFSNQIYGVSVAPTVLHPSRYLMQAIPFLIPDSPIWLHRIWQVLLWLSTTVLSGWLLARRLAIKDSVRLVLFMGWAFLFILIGPVYYHLQVAAIIVLAGYQRERFWRSTLVILIASAWAGISRVNWFPVPAMLAISLYLLEEPAGKHPWRYLVKPLFWGLSGVAVAFASQYLYAVASGNPVEQFATSFTSDLLWYRLLPNPTYPLGVLPAALLVSAPLLLVIFYRLAGRWKAYHAVRLLGLGAMLLILLTGGLIVSTKIGGGSNLHNIDAYLSLLLVIGSYFFFEQITPEKNWQGPGRAAAIPWAVSVYLLVFPALLTITAGSPYSPPDRERIDRALSAISISARDAIKENKDVLFIAERQLLTFKYIKEIPLVPEYEKVFLMEMAMANNQDYLDQFYDDIKNQRFKLIVSEPLNTRLKGSGKSFGEENDAWVKNVAAPLLCYYESFRTYRELRLQLLKPRSTPGDCPDL